MEIPNLHLNLVGCSPGSLRTGQTSSIQTVCYHLSYVLSVSLWRCSYLNSTQQVAHMMRAYCERGVMDTCLHLLQVMIRMLGPSELWFAAVTSHLTIFAPINKLECWKTSCWVIHTTNGFPAARLECWSCVRSQHFERDLHVQSDIHVSSNISRTSHSNPQLRFHMPFVSEVAKYWCTAHIVKWFHHLHILLCDESAIACCSLYGCQLIEGLCNTCICFLANHYELYHNARMDTLE